MDEHPILEGFRFIKNLGSSTIGRSGLYQTENGYLYVIKQIAKTSIGSDFKIQNFKSRLDHIASVKAPMVVPFQNVFENDDSIFAIREYIEGTPLSSIEHNANINANTFFSIWKLIARSFFCLHSHHIAPNTIKPSNIFVKPGNQILISDLYPPIIKLDALLHTPQPIDCGFMAPEFFSKRTTPDNRSDNYSLGVLLSYMITGKLPFDTHNMFTMLQQISDGNISIDQTIPLQIREIIESLTKLNPEDRGPIVGSMSCSHGTNGSLIPKSPSHDDAFPVYLNLTADNHDEYPQNFLLGETRKMSSSARMPISAMLILKPSQGRGYSSASRVVRTRTKIPLPE